ncbi:DUF6034 family protein [Ktedonobacter racemifer]|uniref:Uncharacterized protein n=1 Tax=Ktedonobacter racemifer DSM 44963 TaxID=485913 RepID=D6U5S8_KTERA|nr:DUF6034 family protein [Ktedonobacter racemifer]EFH80339.1 hypothetical protein Krac_0930 [Ktedonobacter racemifer DSM 44963]
MKKDEVHKQVHVKHVFARPAPAPKVLLLTMLLIVVGSLAACQSTPTTPPVVGKQQNINTIVQNNTQNTNLLQGVPRTLVYQQTQGAVTLNVNAPVQLPHTSKIPVVTTQPACFTQDTVNKITNTLIPGKQLYDNTVDWSKVDYQKLAALIQALQLPGAQGNKEITTQSVNVGVGLALLATRGKSPAYSKFSNPTSILSRASLAPETRQRTPMTGQLQRLDESDFGSGAKVIKGFHGNMLSVYADSGKGYDTTLDIMASDDAKNCSVNLANHDITDVYNYSDLTGPARGMSMSLGQAKALAQQTLQAVGATDLRLTQVQLGTLIPHSASDHPNTMNQAYGMWFTRDVAGVPTTVDLTNPNQNAYQQTYPYERLFMLVNDTGVIEFSWISPMHETGTVSSNAQILSFQDAMNQFKQQFFIHYAQNDTSKGNTTYTIKRITLGMMRVQNKDQATYTMVPVWDFYGTGGPQPSNPLLIDHSMESFLTINAIDGSVIDRTLGY